MPINAQLERQRRERSALGLGAWAGRAVAPGPTCWVARAFSSPFSTNSSWRRPLAPKPQALPCSPSWHGLPVSGAALQRLPSSASQPASQRAPPSGPAGQSLPHAGLSPADASPRLWPELGPEQSPQHRCSHSLALDKLLGKIMEPAFLNPPLSGEKRALLSCGRGYLAARPRGQPPAADPCGPCLCCWLLSEGPCREVGGPRGGQQGSNQPLSEVSTISLAFSGWLANRKWAG